MPMCGEIAALVAGICLYLPCLLKNFHFQYMISRIKFFLLTAVALGLGSSAYSQTGFGESSLFNDSWLFVQGDVEGAQAAEFDDSRWEELSLPHDWSVKGVLSPANASCTGFLPAGIGWYRKHFVISSCGAAACSKDGDGCDAGCCKDAACSGDGNCCTAGSCNGGREDRYFIYFEGVSNRSTVWINGHLLGSRPSGYASFLYDLSPYLNLDGDNVIAVKVDHSRIADSRWYAGSGIYRNVWLTRASELHFAQWGVGYRTLSVKNGVASVMVDVEIDGPLEKGCSVEARLVDDGGKVVATGNVKAERKIEIPLKVRNARLWDLDGCYMYRLEVALSRGKELIDRSVVNAGLRTLEFDADRGFALNGKWMKIKGVCLHHDAGVLGAAVPEEFLIRRFQQLKELGANAIRTSHNPQSPMFYDLCDRMGFLVMDEAFDEWEFNKKKWVEGWNVGRPSMDGTADFFEEWCERDVTDMVRRDRNHPSIFLWSIGNEVDYPNDPYSHPILDGDGSDFTQPVYGGYRPSAPDAMRIGGIARRLAAAVRAADDSRPVTGALAGVLMSNQTGYPEAVDVVGYNYTESRYLKDHLAYPERIIYGSENRSDYSAWKAVRDNEFIFGQFIWTGADYLGEAREWPSRGFYSGLLDLANNIKPRGRFRQALWREDPVCWLGAYSKDNEEVEDSYDAWDSWDFEDGDVLRVVCYTNAAKVRLSLNGRPVGAMKDFDDETGIIGWDVPFERGVLLAEAFDEDGNLVASHSLTSTSAPAAIKAELLDCGLRGKDGLAGCTESGAAGLCGKDCSASCTESGAEGCCGNDGLADCTESDAEGYSGLRRYAGMAGRVAIIQVEVTDAEGLRCKLADNAIRCLVDGGIELLGMESGDNSDMGDWTDDTQRAYRGRLTIYVRVTAPGSVTLSSPYLKGCSLVIS